MLIRRISDLRRTASLFMAKASRSSIILDSNRSGRQAADGSLQLRLLRLWDQKYDSTLFHGIQIVIRAWNGELFPVVSRQASLWPRPTLTSTSVQTPLTWGGVLTSWSQPLPTSGLRRKLSDPSTQGSSLRWSAVYGTSISRSHLHSSGYFGQLDSLGLPSQTGALDCRFSTPYAEDPPLGGDDRLSPEPPVHPGQEQCSGGLPVSPKPGPETVVSGPPGSGGGRSNQSTEV